MTLFRTFAGGLCGAALVLAVPMFANATAPAVTVDATHHATSGRIANRTVELSSADRLERRKAIWSMTGQGITTDCAVNAGCVGTVQTSAR